MTQPTPYVAERTTAAWQELDRQHYLHPFTDYKFLHAKGTRVIVKAEGVYLYDSEGNRILDGMAGLWCVNVGHGTVIKPASAALFGLLGATLFLAEKPTLSRIAGAAAIMIGLLIFGAESLTTIGSQGIAGDLMFLCAGLFWAAFGTLLRYWRVAGTQAVAVVGAMSVFVFVPLFAVFHGFDTMLRMGWGENILQILVQGLIAGAGPIYLFARSVTLLGAGRAATFPSLVPIFSLVIGFLALGTVPTWPQVAGLAIVVLGFRLTLR